MDDARGFVESLIPGQRRPRTTQQQIADEVRRACDATRMTMHCTCLTALFADIRLLPEADLHTTGIRVWGMHGIGHAAEFHRLVPHLPKELPGLRRPVHHRELRRSLRDWLLHRAQETVQGSDIAQQPKRVPLALTLSLLALDPLADDEKGQIHWGDGVLLRDGAHAVLCVLPAGRGSRRSGNQTVVSGADRRVHSDACAVLVLHELCTLWAYHVSRQ